MQLRKRDETSENGSRKGFGHVFSSFLWRIHFQGWYSNGVSQAPLHCIQSTQPTRCSDQRSTEYITNATHRKLKNAVACRNKNEIFWNRSNKNHWKLLKTVKTHWKPAKTVKNHPKPSKTLKTLKTHWTTFYYNPRDLSNLVFLAINLKFYHRGCRNSNEIGTRVPLAPSGAVNLCLPKRTPYMNFSPHSCHSESEFYSAISQTYKL